MDYFSALISRSYITTGENVLSVVMYDLYQVQFSIGEKDFVLFDWEYYGGAKLSQTKDSKNGIDRYLIGLEIPNEAKKACEEMKQACKLVCIHVDFQDRYYIQGTEWEVLSETVDIGTYFCSTKCNDEMIISSLSRSPVLVCAQSPIINNVQFEEAE